jgi:hypothetical protein
MHSFLRFPLRFELSFELLTGPAWLQ